MTDPRPLSQKANRFHVSNSVSDSRLADLSPVPSYSVKIETQGIPGFFPKAGAKPEQPSFRSRADISLK